MIRQDLYWKLIRNLLKNDDHKILHLQDPNFKKYGKPKNIKVNDKVRNNKREIGVVVSLDMNNATVLINGRYEVYDIYDIYLIR